MSQKLTLKPQELKKWAEKHIRFIEWREYQGKGLCPFHNDKNPSFSFNAELGAWQCFAGCGKGGINDLAKRLKIQSPLKKSSNSSVLGMKTETVYQYRDGGGQLLFEVVRFNKSDGNKDIRYRRPGPQSQYIWNARGVKKVPYRLPELLIAAKEGVKKFYIVEGEKCVESLRSLGPVATCNPNGAGKWKDEYTEYFPKDAQIIIIPDADTPGMNHAHQVADSFTNRGFDVKVISLGYPLLDKHGDDIYDWLVRDGHTLNELKKIIEDTDSFTNYQRENIQIIEPEMLEFPIKAMPDVLIPLIRAGSESLEASPALLAVPMLTILGSAISNNVQFEIKPGWREKPNLFTAVVSHPGSRKTPALKIAMNPLKLKQDKDREDHLRRVDESKQEHKEWSTRKDKAKKDQVKFSEPEPVKVLKKDVPLHYVTDATTEAMTACLELNKRGFIIIHDELTALVTSMNQYKGGKGNDRQWILQSWSGSPISLVRKGREAGNGLDFINVPDSCISITGGIQPSEISRIIGDQGGGSSDGFAQRFLIAYPDFYPSFYKETSGIPEEMERDYKEFYDKVFLFGGKPKVLRMNEKAKKLWIACYNSNTGEILEGKLLEIEVETWHKMMSQFARIALIIHVCRLVSGETESEMIEEVSILNAWTLIDYFKANIRKVYRKAFSIDSSNKINIVIDILKKADDNKLSLRDVQRNSKKLGNAKGVKKILEQMKKANIIREIPQGKTTVYTFTDDYINNGGY